MDMRSPGRGNGALAALEGTKQQTKLYFCKIKSTDGYKM